MTVRITQANISGFTGDSEMIPVEPEQSQFYLPSAVELLDEFSVDIIVEGVYPDPLNPELVTYEYATDVRSSFDWSSIGVTFTKLNPYTVRLTGPANNVFIDQFYRFKMTDYTEKVLQANTTEPFLGLIQYKMPNPTNIMKTFAFEADIPAELVGAEDVTEEFDMFQWYFWRFQVALENIEQLNARGLK